ncbi:hypothetical protein M513_06552 [Trichuris suis]|uniref:Uncharacterized protein n=1 Tax=Trichuris suis TaxID=68888 RepID=A0A085M5M2_9BILA|nr:hypothetical protein M513_06552 [Trichuris suis]
MPPLSTRYEEQIESRTRWWPTYGSYGFSLRATPRDTYGSYVRDVFTKPRKLYRSVSVSSLSCYRDTDDVVGIKLKKSPSYSSLSPSHALPYDCRVPQRYIEQIRPKQVEAENWYLNSYTPYRFRRTMLDLGCCAKPASCRSSNVMATYPSDHLSYYPYRDSYFGNQRWMSHSYYQRSNLRQSCAYLRDYVHHRLSHDDRSLPYIRESYERPTYNERFLRFFRGGQSTAFVGTPLSLPRYERSRIAHRIYMVTSRLPF